MATILKQKEVNLETAQGALRISDAQGDREQRYLDSLSNTSRYNIAIKRPGSSDYTTIGSVSVTNWSVSALKDNIIPPALARHGIGPGERVAQFTTFYPFGDAKEELEGKGLANTILKHFLKEFESNGMAGAYVITTMERMQNILIRNDFEQLGRFVFLNIF